MLYALTLRIFLLVKTWSHFGQGYFVLFDGVSFIDICKLSCTFSINGVPVVWYFFISLIGIISWIFMWRYCKRQILIKQSIFNSLYLQVIPNNTYFIFSFFVECNATSVTGFLMNGLMMLWNKITNILKFYFRYI